MIVPEEAEVLRRIFREMAAGRGYVRIARHLNADGVPPPWRRAWVAASIRAMVFRDLYRAPRAWGVASEPLWQAAHARLAGTREVCLRRTDGRTWGRPTNPTTSGYLLTGLLACKHCGGSLHVSRQSGRHGEGLWCYYVCARQRTRGVACPRRLGGK